MAPSMAYGPAHSQTQQRRSSLCHVVTGSAFGRSAMATCAWCGTTSEAGIDVNYARPGSSPRRWWQPYATSEEEWLFILQRAQIRCGCLSGWRLPMDLAGHQQPSAPSRQLDPHGDCPRSAGTSGNAGWAGGGSYRPAPASRWINFPGTPTQPTPISRVGRQNPSVSQGHNVPPITTLCAMSALIFKALAIYTATQYTS